MRVNRKHTEYFTPSEYMISDSALENCTYVVSAFKKPPLQEMPFLQEVFNTRLAKARIRAKHTIGLLKARFPWLRNIRITITEKKETMERILKYIDCCVIIHNLLVQSDPCPDHWLDENEDDVSDIDDSERAPTE